jgi:zinc transport system substrate-binding protein
MVRLKKIIVFLSVLFVLTLSGCNNTDEDKVTIYTTLYPQYDVVRALVGDLANVEYLLPPGTSAHSFEPSPQTMIDIIKSEMFIYTGDHLEPWVAGMLTSNDVSELRVIDSSDYVTLINTNLEHDHEEEAEDDHEDEDHDEMDPHFWSDPDNMIDIVTMLERELKKIFDDNQSLIEDRADQYRTEMEEMNTLYQDLMDNKTTSYIMHGGHNSIGYFVTKYDLEYVNPYEGFSTDAAPTGPAIANMIDVMDEHEIEYLFSEKLISQTVSNTISEQTGATILYIYSMGNVGSDDFETEITMYEMMQHNLAQFRIGLGYNGTAD